MARTRIKKGNPFTFQEFVFFSPKQFDENEIVSEKNCLFKLKICVNTNRVFYGPFFRECIGQEEINNTELKKMLELINETPNLIIYGEEYTVYDDFNGLWKIYGGQPSFV